MLPHSSARLAFAALLATAATLLCLPGARAQLVGTPGLTITGTPNAGINPTDNRAFTLGYEFTLSSAILVTDLGYYDYLGNGLAESHQVGIWTTSGATLLVQMTVPSGTVGTLNGGFRFAQVTSPVTLSAGTYRVGGLSTGSFDPFLIGGSVATASGVTYVRDEQIQSASLAYPTLNTGHNTPADAAIFGGNFAFTSLTPIPEPSTAFAAAGLLGLVGGGRWRRRQG